jgi:aldehyde:ferredoxin oxidoreductase
MMAGKEYGSLNHILNEYYEEREWNVDGVPSKKKLIDLGLRDIVKDMG